MMTQNFKDKRVLITGASKGLGKAAFISGQSIMVDGGLSVVGQESIARRLRGLDH